MKLLNLVYALALLWVLFINGCSSQRETWKIVNAASPAAIDAALNSDAEYPYAKDFARSTVPGIDPPVHLRPCCAFGMDLKTSIYGLPIPLVKVTNMVDTTDLGLHTYDAGLVGHGTDRDERESSETNGVLYTCKAGFIDIAHVRDYSDWTVYLTFWIYRHLGKQLEMVLPPELGERRILIHPFETNTLSMEQELILSVTMAQWAAYKLSIWHEIAQWHGYGLEAFPEYISSYSVEDLYSNVLGTKIAAAIIYGGGTKTDQVYSRNFDQWLKNTLNQLGAQSIQSTRIYMKAADGYWWDSRSRIPYKYVVLKRNYEVDNIQRPMILPTELLSIIGEHYKDTCANTEPLYLEVVDSIFGFDMQDLITLEITIDEEYAQTFTFPTPSKEENRIISDQDFAFIAKSNRQSDIEEMAEKEISID